MDIFFKTISSVFISLILYLILSKQGKDAAFVLSLCTCCMILISAISYVRPIFDFIKEIQNIGKIDNEILTVILKTLGIGILTEISCNICTDAGNSALGKTLQMMSAALMLWLSIPMFRRFITLIQEILLLI